MEGKEVKISIEIEGVGDQITNVNDLTDSFENLNSKTKESTKESGFFGNKIESVKKTFKGIGSDARGVANGFKSFAQGLGLSSKAATGLAVGLSALGIPLLLLAITALVEYFKNFEAGVKVITKVTNVLAAVVGKITEGFVALINLDFSGFVGSFKGIGSAASDAADATNRLFKANQDLFDLQEKNIVGDAKLIAAIDKQKKIVADTTTSYEERIEALERLEKAEVKLIKNKQAETTATLEILNAQLDLENNFEKQRELRLEIQQITADQIKLESDLTLKTGEAAKKIRGIDQANTNQAIAENKRKNDAKAKSDAQFDKELLSRLQQNELSEIADVEERAARALEIQKENEQLAINQSTFSKEQKRILLLEVDKKYDLIEAQQLAEKNAAIELQQQEDIDNEILRKENDNARLLALEEKHLKERDQLHQESVRFQKQAELDLFNTKLDILDRTAFALSNFAGKSKAIALGIVAVQKGVAIADVVVNASQNIATITGSAAAESARNTSFYAKFGPLGAIIAAGVNAKTLINAKKRIVATKISAGAGIASILASGLGSRGLSGASGSIDTGGVSTPSTSTFNPSQALQNEQDINRTSTIEQQGSQSSIRAYIVSGEITNSIEADTKIKNLTRL